MARIKQAVIQRDMSAGELRGDFLERDDVELRGRGLREATNMRALATGGLEARPGSVHVRTEPQAQQIHEIRPADGESYGVDFTNGALRVLNSDGTVVFSDETVPWTDGSLLWVLPLREQTIIGSEEIGLYVLEYDGSSWALGAYPFDTGSGGSLRQPYWNFFPGTTIQPDDVTGSVTITASDDVFEAGHVGERIRYGGREITITAFTSATEVDGTVVSRLPPSFRLTVGDTSLIQVGDLAVGQESGWQGVVSAIVSATQIDVLTTQNYDGPDASATEDVSFPSTTQALSAKTGIDPVASTFWDEALLSDVRGYPRSGAAVLGRLVLCDFPLAPNLVAISSARAMNDFSTGLNDDDAIVRTIGNDAPRFYHAINAGDLLLLSDRGCYVVDIRGSGLLTPATFAPVLFDRRGCNGVRPVSVGDGVVFVEASGQTVSAALLDGNIYLKWSVRALTTYHNQLIRSPVGLCAPALTTSPPEKYLFIVNSDGTMAAVSWEENFADQRIGFMPWETQGSYRFATNVFSDYWIIVDRTIAGVSRRFIERFDFDALLDCSITADPNAAAAAPHLVGEEVHVAWNGRNAGTATVAADGSVPMEDVSSEAEIGLNFQAVAAPWPVELIESPRIGTLTVRLFKFIVSVQVTGPFQIRANDFTRTVGGYAFGDDLTQPPPVQTKVFRAPVTGRRDHPDVAAIKSEPGFFRVLSLGQEVQG